MFRNIQHHLLNYFTKAYQKAFNIDIPLHINLCKIEDKGDYYSDIAETIIEQRKKKLLKAWGANTQLFAKDIATEILVHMDLKNIKVDDIRLIEQIEVNEKGHIIININQDYSKHLIKQLNSNQIEMESLPPFNQQFQIVNLLTEPNLNLSLQASQTYYFSFRQVNQAINLQQLLRILTNQKPTLHFLIGSQVNQLRLNWLLSQMDLKDKISIHSIDQFQGEENKQSIAVIPINSNYINKPYVWGCNQCGFEGSNYLEELSDKNDFSLLKSIDLQHKAEIPYFIDEKMSQLNRKSNSLASDRDVKNEIIRVVLKLIERFGYISFDGFQQKDLSQLWRYQNQLKQLLECEITDENALAIQNLVQHINLD